MEDSNFSKLHPMAIGLLSAKKREPKVTFFVRRAYHIVSANRDRLTPKLINDINNWCENILSGMELVPDDSLIANSIIKREKLTVFKRRASDRASFPAIILKDEAGWKYWMICPDAFNFPVGASVCITGKIRDINDGMIFLTHPKSIIKSFQPGDKNGLS